MKRPHNWTVITFLLALSGLPAGAQDRPERLARIDVEHYTVEAEINPRTQSLSAAVSVRFTPLDGALNSASFELHNSLNV
jgi:predicted component of type VI protein secretion system